MIPELHVRRLRCGFRLAALGSMIVSLTATATVAQSIDFARFDVARYGAACLLDLSSTELPGSGIIVSYDTIVEVSGVPHAVVQRWADDRSAEHQIAAAVLHAEKDGDTFVDPPEPFLTILRQAQSDCQSYHRSLNVLGQAKERTIAQSEAIPAFQPWRLKEDYADSMRRERIQRLRNVILTGKDGIRAGYETEVIALASVIARRDVPSETFTDDYTYDTAGRLAAQLLDD